MNKKLKKLIDKKCHFCEKTNYNFLDLHRIIPGSKYTNEGTVVACSNCHRRIHANEIRIDKWYLSTKGKVLHYFINDVEYFK